MSLNTYNKKRDFNKTNEPIGKKYKQNKKLKFVIQHHMARRDHYDLRLEWNGVYISWAIPKGPSFNIKDKRLAVKVEDHPISYGNFEGTIPKGEYGGGTIMLWDKGYWTYKKNSKPNFKNGPIKFELNGKRLKGNWSLVKMNNKNWLLIKDNDNYVNTININDYKTSLKTNRTMKEIKDTKNNNYNDIKLTNLKKIIINKNVTKGDIINYYKDIANKMMPFLDNRLISVVRCPNGINDETFFMKHLNTKSKNIGKKMIKDSNNIKKNYYYIKNPSGLIEEVNMNSYEYHIWGSKQNRIDKPDILVFDFDPDKNLPLKKIRNGVKDLKNILDNLKLKSYLKTSGGKGYHVFVPLISTSWKKTESIAKNISELMANNWPNKYTISMSKKKRTNKIFIDYFRNKLGATSVCPYSIRLNSKISISCPINWNDLDKIKPDTITIKNYKKYIKDNPWKDFFIYDRI